jgi:Family of unknown function (DUF5996)
VPSTIGPVWCGTSETCTRPGRWSAPRPSTLPPASSPGRASCSFPAGSSRWAGQRPGPPTRRFVAISARLQRCHAGRRRVHGRDRAISQATNLGGLPGCLDGLGIDADIWEKPQELSDTTLFSENRHDCTIVPEHAQRFHRVLCAIDGAFEEFRSPYFGRTGVQFWWGGFDFAVLLFTGRHLMAPGERGYIMRFDLDAEQLNAGFWPGDDNAPEARFWAYVVPRPDGCEVAPIRPAPAAWVEAISEWILPYERARASDDPRRAILDFLHSVYRVAVANGGWDAAAQHYESPPPAPRA